MIPEEFRDLLDGKNFADVATVKSDGTPHNTPVWIDHDNYEKVTFNTAKGRVKYNNLRTNPKVSVVVRDSNNPYRYLMVEGKVSEMTEEGALDHIDKLAKKYMGAERYEPAREQNQTRVKVVIDPENIVTFKG